MMGMKRSRGFTLIELLIVVLIILALSGILFKIASLVGQKGSRMKATGQIAALKNAIAEFYAEYGSYPPSPFIGGGYSTSTDYEYENVETESLAFQSWLKTHNDPTNGPFFGDTYRTGGFANSTNFPETLGYRYGLASFLYLRDRDTNRTDMVYKDLQPHWFEHDTDRDLAVKLAWKDLLEAVVTRTDGVAYLKDPGMGSAQRWTNGVLRISDPWGRQYRYLCKPPHTQYKLWSYGLDGKGSPDHPECDADNVGDDAWAE